MKKVCWSRAEMKEGAIKSGVTRGLSWVIQWGPPQPKPNIETPATWSRSIAKRT